MGQIKFLVAFAMISIFTLAIVNYSVGFANDNDSYISILDNPNLSSLDVSIRESLGNEYLEYNDSDNSFQESSIKSGDDNIESGNPFKKVSTVQRSGFKTIMDSIKITIFGNDRNFLIVFNTFMGVLIVIGLLYIWKTWKGGTPE